MKVVGRGNISRFHSYLVPRRDEEQRGLTFSCERSVGVLVVFELDHRVILLEPFQMMHKGIFT
jgi:hypothetical protein